MDLVRAILYLLAKYLNSEEDNKSERYSANLKQERKRYEARWKARYKKFFYSHHTCCSLVHRLTRQVFKEHIWRAILKNNRNILAALLEDTQRYSQKRFGGGGERSAISVNFSLFLNACTFFRPYILSVVFRSVIISSLSLRCLLAPVIVPRVIAYFEHLA